MEFIVAAAVVALIVLVVRSAKKRAEEKAAAEAAAAVARQQAEYRESALVPRIAAANSPAGVLALCDHQPPPSLRFQKSEQAVWVVPDCSYLKTKKEVTYHGAVFRGVVPGSEGRDHQDRRITRAPRGERVPGAGRRRDSRIDQQAYLLPG